MNRLLGSRLLALALVLPSCERIETSGGRADGPGISICERELNYDGAAVSNAVLTRRFGNTDGLAFGEIKDVAVAHGTLFVADGLGRTVQMIGAEGSVTGSFGRTGSGPGEFLYPVKVELTGPDTVAVFDAQRWTISYFGTDGSFGRHEYLPAMARFGQGATVEIEPDGSVFALTHTDFQKTLEESIAGRRKGIGRGIIGIAELDRRQGRWLDRFWVPGQEVFVDLDAGALSDIWFGAKDLLTAGGGVLWTADGRSGDLVMWVLTASRPCRVRYNARAQEVSAAERDSFHLAKDLVWRGEERVLRARARRKGVELPATKALISQIVADDGSVWVRTPSEDRSRDRWLLVDSVLTVRRILYLPATVTMLLARGDRVYGISQTPEGVPVLEEYNIVVNNPPRHDGSSGGG